MIAITDRSLKALTGMGNYSYNRIKKELGNNSFLQRSK